MLNHHGPSSSLSHNNAKLNLFKLACSHQKLSPIEIWNFKTVLNSIKSQLKTMSYKNSFSTFNRIWISGRTISSSSSITKRKTKPHPLLWTTQNWLTYKPNQNMLLLKSNPRFQNFNHNSIQSLDKIKS